MLEADGRLKLLGRDSVTINSGGEKIFAEEVEIALKDHPGVYDAIVCGTPNARFGSQVTALVQLREGHVPTESELKAHAGLSLAAYKLPRALIFVDRIERAPSGKADYRIDAEFMHALRAGLPPCAGVAVGLDRLLMLHQGQSSLSAVSNFVA